MLRAIVVRELAQSDIDEESRYYTLNDGSEIAVRFLDEIAQAVKSLAAFPELGDAWPTSDPELRGLRRLLLPRFPYWLFYLHSDTAIEIIRVLHHRRDIEPLLKH